MRDSCNCLWWRFRSCLMLRGVVTGTSSGSPCMAKYPLVILTGSKPWSMPLKPNYQTWLFHDCSMTVPFRAFRILVGGTIPFRSIPDFSNPWQARHYVSLYTKPVMELRKYRVMSRKWGHELYLVIPGNVILWSTKSHVWQTHFQNDASALHYSQYP